MKAQFKNDMIFEAIQRKLFGNKSNSANKRNLYEAEESKEVKEISSEKIDKMIRGVRDKLEDINAALMNSGLPKDSKPCRQLKQMYQILASFDPVSVKMTEYMKPKVEASIQNMVEADSMGTGDIKIASNVDKNTQKVAADFSQKYERDIELTPEVK